MSNGVIIVIAAGNGDILSGQENGVNLTNNPISPVCNNGGNYNRYSIGVRASDKDGYKTLWTNYGDCTPFMAPGVGIISTSIPAYNSNYGTNYNIANGTSFSTPIISGIIALGYNQYGQVSPNSVYTSLYESLTLNNVGNYIIDADKYLDYLGKKVEEEKYKQQQIDNENKLKQKAEKVFNGIKLKFEKYSKVKKEKIYNSLIIQLNGIKIKTKGDKLIILNQLIYLIDNELGGKKEVNLDDLFGDMVDK